MGNGGNGGAGLLVVRAVTPVHFGVGRAPGAVDLPVARDHMGYPIAPASGLKGALKRFCGMSKRAIEEINVGGARAHRINCSDDGRICCCLFGPEPGESGVGAGAVSITDLTLLAIPVPSHNLGWVYVTTPYLLTRAADLIRSTEAVEGLGDVLADLSGRAPYFTGEPPHGVVRVPGITYSDIQHPEGDERERVVNALGRLASGGLSNELPERLLVVPEIDGREVVGRGIIRYWRVRIDYETKTVTAGPWSEEYVPPDTVFVGAVVDTGWRNAYCGGSMDLLDEFKKFFSGKAVLVGGKGTVGKGLLRLELLRPEEG